MIDGKVELSLSEYDLLRNDQRKLQEFVDSVECMSESEVLRDGSGYKGFDRKIRLSKRHLDNIFNVRACDSAEYEIEDN